jgi:hypothetical protein
MQTTFAKVSGAPAQDPAYRPAHPLLCRRADAYGAVAEALIEDREGVSVDPAVVQIAVGQ